MDMFLARGGCRLTIYPLARRHKASRFRVSFRLAFGEVESVHVSVVDATERKAKRWTTQYDVDPGGGRSIVNEEEAERVRAIFALFEEHRSALITLAEIKQRGWRLKSWTRKSGQFRAGGPFALNSLRRLLTNVLYTAAIRHKGQSYPGEHSAILAPGTWERVQNLISQRAAFARGRSRNKQTTPETFARCRARG